MKGAAPSKYFECSERGRGAEGRAAGGRGGGEEAEVMVYGSCRLTFRPNVNSASHSLLRLPCIAYSVLELYIFS